MKKAGLFFAVFVAATPCVARIITVDANGTGDYPTIQAAIDDANNGDTVQLLPGRYTGPGNRDVDFKGKAITVRSTDPNEPNIVAATVLEGEWIDMDCGGHRGFNFRSGEGRDSVLAGVTITRFMAPCELMHSDEPVPAGGGIFCEDSSPTISHCVLKDNLACGEELFSSYPSFGGNICCKGNCGLKITHSIITGGFSSLGAGGIDCLYSSGDMEITHCIIKDNWGKFGWGGIGCASGTISNCIISDNVGGYVGGISSVGSITHCTVTGNICWYGGGAGIQAYWGTTISHCTIDNNLSGGPGGGIYCTSGYSTSGKTTIRYCMITNNSAVSGEYYYGEGGGIYCDDPNILITTSTIAHNQADANAGGIYGSPTLTNCILWGNNCPNEPHILGEPNISYSDVQDGYPGEGNIDADPCFADADNGDYHLKSQAGRWDANEGRWAIDEVTSPCIDAGDPMSPIGLEPFPNGGIINMGAYGGTAEASKSYFGRPPCKIIVAGDVNGDCEVNFEDFRLMALHWLEAR